jgi:hypothetical protein
VSVTPLEGIDGVRVPDEELLAPSLAPAGAAHAPRGRSWISLVGEPEEQAQLLARRSIELATRLPSDAMAEAALELMRAANHDPATLEHALVVCRSVARDDPANEQIQRAIRLLEQVVAFLGVPPEVFETGTAPRRRPEVSGSGA